MSLINSWGGGEVIKDSPFILFLYGKYSKKGKSTTYFIIPVSFADVRRLKAA